MEQWAEELIREEQDQIERFSEPEKQMRKREQEWADRIAEWEKQMREREWVEEYIREEEIRRHRAVQEENHPPIREDLCTEDELKDGWYRLPGLWHVDSLEDLTACCLRPQFVAIHHDKNGSCCVEIPPDVFLAQNRDFFLTKEESETLTPEEKLLRQIRAMWEYVVEVEEKLQKKLPEALRKERAQWEKEKEPFSIDTPLRLR